MKNLFIRVTESNNTKTGEVSYTKEQIKEMCENVCLLANGGKYDFIYHDKDSDVPHYHCVICLNRHLPFSIIKDIFKFGYIEECRSVYLCLNYLLHKNSYNKHKYDIKEVISDVIKV